MHVEHGTLVSPLEWTLYWNKDHILWLETHNRTPFKQSLLPTTPIWIRKIHIATMRYQLGTKESNPEIRISSRKPFPFSKWQFANKRHKIQRRKHLKVQIWNFFYYFWIDKNHTSQHKCRAQLAKDIGQQHKTQTRIRKNDSLLEEASIYQFLF